MKTKAQEVYFKKLLTDQQQKFLGQYKYVREDDDYGLRTSVGIITKDGRRYIVKVYPYSGSLEGWFENIKKALTVVIEKINEDMKEEKA